MNTSILNKLAEVLGSRNALVALVSIILLAFSVNGVDLGSPDKIVDLFIGKNLGEIATVLFLNFFTPLSKIVQKLIKKEFDWSWLKSSNFITNVLSIVTLLIGAFMDEVTAGMLTALGLQIFNFIRHIITPAKNVQEGEG